MKVAVPSGRSPASSVLVADGSNVGFVASICRTSTQWRQNLAPQRISALCWRGVGPKKVRHLFAEIRHHGYSGSYSHLARFLAPWRSREPSFDGDEQVRAEQEQPAPVHVRTLDPMTGRAISPLTAAALCVKPRGQMTARQVANVVALKAASAEFTAMRHLAMRFRGLLRGGTPERLDAWLIDARASGIYAAFCQDDTPGPGSRSERCVGTLEQRAGRRIDQQIEDPQTSDVRPRWCRLAPRSDDAVAGKQLAPRVNQTRSRRLAPPSTPSKPAARTAEPRR